MISPGPKTSRRAWSFPMIEISRSRAPATYASTRATLSWRNASSSAGPRSSGVWARVIPTELPRPEGLIISRGSPVPAANASSSPSTASRADLAPLGDGQADAPDESLEHGLVHPEGGRRHAAARVGQVARLEQRL